MILNLIKLAVGIGHVDQLKKRQEPFYNSDGYYEHTTRMFPKLADELVNGGSLYWVIKRLVVFRQPIVGIHKRNDQEGKGLCIIELEPNMIAVVPQARRPFQGWRYLKPKDTPRDLSTHEGFVDPEMPDDMRTELSRIFLI